MKKTEIIEAKRFANKIALITLMLFSVVVPLSVQAQSYTGSLQGEGTGVKLSDESRTRLHLALDAGIGFNSNPYSLTSAKLAQVGQGGDLLFKIRPLFYLKTGGRKLAVEMGLTGDGGGLFGLPSGRPDFLLFNGRVYGKGEFNKDGAISMFARGDLSTNRKVTEIFVGSLTNITGDVNMGTSVRPGGGSLILTLDGQFQVSDYIQLSDATNTATAQVRDPNSLDNQAFYGHARIAWRFLPQTSVFVDARYGAWLNGEATGLGLTVNPLWVNGGFTGKISRRLSATLAAGYANTFIYSDGTAAGSTAGYLPPTSAAFGAQAEVDWKFSERSRLVLGVKRDMTPAPRFLDMYTNSIYLRYDQRFFQKVAFLLNPSFGYLEFGKPFVVDGAGTRPRTDITKTHRSDLSADVRAELVYYIRDWFGVGFAGSGTWRWTNANELTLETPDSHVAKGTGTDFKNLFSRYEAVLFATLNY